MASLGILNDRQTLNDSLSGSNLSDSFQFSLSTKGGVDLSLNGLSAGVRLSLRSSNGQVLQTATASSASPGEIKFDGLDGGDYSVYIELIPNAPSPPSSSGTVARVAYSGISQGTRTVSPGGGIYYDPNGRTAGSSFTGTFDIDINNKGITNFTLNGQQLRPTFPGAINGLIEASVNFTGISRTTIDGISSDPSIGIVSLQTYAVTSGNFNIPGLTIQSTYDAPATLAGARFDSLFRDATDISNNLVFTTLGVIPSTPGSNGTDNTENVSTNYTLTLTPDWAGETTVDTKAIPNLTSPPTLSAPQTQQTYSNPAPFTDYIGGIDPIDYYSFTVNASTIVTPGATRNGTNVWLNIKNFAANVTAELLNSNLNTIDSINTASGKTNFAEILPAGTYYVKVTSNQTATAPNGEDTRYTLEFARVSLTTDLTYTSEPGKRYITNLWQFDSNGRNSTVGIDPKKPTIVVIHGLNNASPGDPQFVNDELKLLAQEITSKYSGYQVLGLDWGQAAYQSLLSTVLQLGPRDAASRVTNVATWAVSNWLKPLGINASDLTLIGHSLGSYVSATIGQKYPGVKNLYALDPAGPVAALYDLDRDTPGRQAPPRFDSIGATNSFAFFSNQIIPTDNGDQAATAKQSFVVLIEGSTLNFNQNHSAGIYTLRQLVSTGRISSDDDFTYLKTKTGARLSPAVNQYTNRGQRWNLPFRIPGAVPFFGQEHEGVFTMSKRGQQWQISSFKYVQGNNEISNDW